MQSLASDSDYSRLLGFEGRPDVDETELRERYYELSRRLHPDRFQTGSAEEQRASLQATAVLNAAFRTLKDVESRGRWWLARRGESLSRDNKNVPPPLATEVFEVQEKIAERDGSSGAARVALSEELRTIRAGLSRRLAGERERVEEILRGWPTEGTPDHEARKNLKEVLSELSYLRTLSRDVERALED